MREVVVCPVDELPPGARRLVKPGSLEIGVFNVGGRFHALPNVCAHQFGPLCEGGVTGTLTADRSEGWQLKWEREGRILVCPWHALEYDITTGQCLAYPKVRLRRFPVEVKDQLVVLHM